MIDFLVMEAAAQRPGPDLVEAMWAEIEIVCTRRKDDPYKEIRKSLKNRLGQNGAIASITCKLPDHPVLGWYASRAQITEIDFFYEIFRSDGFQDAAKKFKDLKPVDVDREFRPRRTRYVAESGFRQQSTDLVKNDLFGFELDSCFSITGDLASQIFYASPYGDDDSMMETRGSEAMGMSTAVAKDSLGERYGEGQCYHSPSAWAPWFNGYGWDHTFVFLDKRERDITFIMLTDSE